MKTVFAVLAALVSTATAHYTLPQLIVNGQTSAAFQYIRMTANHYSNGPVTSVTDQAIRCYELDYSLASTPTSTATITAGSQVGIMANQAIYHPGAISVYMCATSNAASSSACTGKSWFKIYELAPTYSASTHQLTFPSESMTTIQFTIPKNVPSGQYLIRAEQVALHAAGSYGGAQFYISCAQANVVGGGSGSPGPLVSFPGAYTGYEPGLLLNIYNLPSNFTAYPPAGPAVWQG